MKQLFGQNVTHLYGKITKNKFITPTSSYPIESLNMTTGMHPVRLTDKIEVFYQAPIFNSYLISNEENVSVLFSVDGKVTITRDKIRRDTLYTFRTVKDTNSLRVAEIYKFDVFYPGFKAKGEVEWKRTKTGKKVSIVKTKYGCGYVNLQNNDGSTAIDVVLYKKDQHLHFVQVGEPVTGIVELSVTKIISDNNYGVKNLNIKGILVASERHEIGDTVKCAVKDECFGNYFFVEHVELKIGSVIEAKVESWEKDGVILKYGEYSGYMPIRESGTRRCKKSVRGVVYDFDDKTFLLSKRRNTKMELTRREGINLSVPFDIEEESKSDSSVEEDVVGENRSLAAERKRAKTMNEVDFIMDIKAHPGEAMPVIRYIQYKMEMDEMDAPKSIFKEYLPKVCGEEKDKLCVSFINYLIFMRDAECFKTIKKLAKTCSPKFLEIVASNSEDIQVLRFYFEKTKTKKSFRMYLDALFKENEVEANRLMEKNKEFLSVSIDLIYKHCSNPRTITERLLIDKKDVWLSYIKNETGSYLRGLYRRVVDRKWKVADMKAFYRMWLEFEKENNGNIEEVKTRAKEYVESVKNTKQRE